MLFLKMRQAISHLSPKIYHHPFNQDLLKGTLLPTTFRFFIEQDSLYLHDFSTVLRTIAKRLPQKNYSHQFELLSKEIIDTERNLHFKYLGDPRPFLFFNGKKSPPQKMPIVRAYTEHLIQKANSASIEEAIASILPCFWIYNELGQKLFLSSYHKNNPYCAWIASYSSPQFTQATQSIIETIETLSATSADFSTQQNIIGAFRVSAEYEILFWDHCYYKKQSDNCSLYPDKNHRTISEKFRFRGSAQF